MKRTFIPLALCVAFGLLLVACSGSDTTSNNSTSNTANANKATTNTATTTNTTSSTTTTSGSGEKIGVPECDEFITKYEACINSKVPADKRAQYKPTIDQWRDSWRKLAANPQTKGTLAQICKTSLEQTKASMKTYGCDF